MSLDDDIRKALTALERTVPDGYYDELPKRIEQRLEDRVMEADMSTDRDGKNGDQGFVPADAPPKKKEENTGLHDIKAMAQSAKRRVSRRITTQSDAEEQLLLSASGSMKQVVLPDPNKEVAVEVAPAVDTPAHAQERAAAARGGIPVWVYGAVAVVAAAAVVFFVVRGRKGDESKSEGTQVASGELSPPELPQALAPAGGAPAPSAEPIDVAGEGNSAAATVAGDGELAVATPIEPAEPPQADDAPPGATGSGGAAAERRDRPADPRPSADPKTPARPPKDAARPEARRPDPAPAAKKPAAADGTRSLDDLLDEAAGPVVADKDQKPATDKPTSAPAKTDITRDEISAGMSKVLGRVQGCYDAHKESGTVMIAVVIDPGGKVSSASATGKFAGTDTGACVAEAVKKAGFASWDGKPKKINYPFLLSQ